MIAGKKIKGRKRHIVVDTLGHLVGLQVHAADIQDRDGAVGVVASIRYLYPWISIPGFAISLPMAAMPAASCGWNWRRSAAGRSR
jgi:hypothetical protein